MGGWPSRNTTHFWTSYECRPWGSGFLFKWSFEGVGRPSRLQPTTPSTSSTSSCGRPPSVPSAVHALSSSKGFCGGPPGEQPSQSHSLGRTPLSPLSNRGCPNLIRSFHEILPPTVGYSLNPNSHKSWLPSHTYKESNNLCP